MNRVILGGLLTAACVAGGSAAYADGYDDTGAFYFSPMAQYDLLDDKRTSRNGFGWQVGLGYDFLPNFAAEFALSNSAHPITNSGATEKMSAGTLDVLYKILPVTSTFRPYTLVGGGATTDSIGRSAGAGHTSWVAEAGVGMFTALGSQFGSNRFQLRTEVKYRREFIQNVAYIPNNPGDVLFGVGLTYMFGAPTPPPPPVVQPPPVVEQAPPPPPPPPPLPPADSDMDGVPDTIDRCPNTPRGDKVDAYGCTIKDEIRLPGVTFAINSDELTSESDTVLGYAVDTLKQHPEFVIEVDGHTDNTGSDKLNNALSQRRADSVMRYLKSHGVTNTLTAKGYGKAHPIEDNRTAEGRLANRRVALKVLSGL